MVSICSDSMIETSIFTDPLREVALQRTIDKLVELVESYLLLRFVFSCTTSIQFSCVSDPQTCLCPPNQVQRLLARISALALEQSRRHFQSTTQFLHVSQPTQDRADTHR